MNDSFGNIHFGDRLSFKRNMDEKWKKITFQMLWKKQQQIEAVQDGQPYWSVTGW